MSNICLSKSHDDFISESIRKFGEKFDYLGIYTHSYSIFTFRCKQHNITFQVSCRNHLRSNTGSCPSCKSLFMKNLKQIDPNYFITKSKKIFGDDWFDYSKTNYISMKERIVLICKKHNHEFEIEPKSHCFSKSGGCIYCNNEIKNKELLDDFITKYQDQFDLTTLDLSISKNINQQVRCNKCEIYIKFCFGKFEGECKGCIDKEIKNKLAVRQRLLDIGKNINNVLQMRIKFHVDEYIKKVTIEGLQSYYVSNYGKVFNKDKVELKGHTNLQGYVFVRLQVSKGSKLYRVHRLVCYTFNKKGNENQNVVDHINRIRNDNRAVNLRFITQQENIQNVKRNTNINKHKQDIVNEYMLLDKEDEIFKNIKDTIYGDFENYSISNYGRIRNNQTNKLLTPRVSDEGYLTVQLRVYNILIHRLVCEIFNSKPTDINVVVNHINEIKHDNYYKNLEYISIAKNNQHSKNIRINMLDENKNIIKTFSSYTECYKYFGKNPTNSNIQYQMRKNRKAYGYYWSIA